MAFSTRLADTANLTSPSAAPRTIRFSDHAEHVFQIERLLSFPGGHAKEQGGTIVADAQSRLSVQNIGGLGSTAGSFSPDLVVKDPAKFTAVGFLHTHPYDRSDGSVNGVSFSGGDIAWFIDKALTIMVVQSGPRLFVMLRTARSPAYLDFTLVDDAQNLALQQLVNQGRTFQ